MDRVCSKSNPIDGVSRVRTAGPAETVRPYRFSSTVGGRSCESMARYARMLRPPASCRFFRWHTQLPRWCADSASAAGTQPPVFVQQDGRRRPGSLSSNEFHLRGTVDSAATLENFVPLRELCHEGSLRRGLFASLEKTFACGMNVQVQCSMPCWNSSRIVIGGGVYSCSS